MNKAWKETLDRIIANGSETLDLSDTGLTDDDLIELAHSSGSLDRVKCLRLARNRSITDAGLEIITKGLPGLAQLDLSECYEIGDDGVRAIAEKLTALTRLDLSYCGVGDDGVRAIAEKLTALTRLDLSGCGVGADGARAIAEKLTALTQLDLRNCVRVGDDGVRAIAENLTALTQLELSYCGVGDDGVRAIAEKLTALTQLDLSYCGVGDDGVRAIAENLTALTQLDLSYCGVGDDGVRAIAENLTALTQLDLSYCGVGDDGARAIAEKLTALTQLELSGCGVGDDGARAIAENLTALTQLDLSHCRLVGDDGVRAIAGRLDKLEVLTLFDCSNLTNASLSEITLRLNRLTSLDLSGCQRIDTIPETIDRLPCLQVLRLSDLPRLSTLPRALRSLGQLRELDLHDNPGLGLPVELIDSTTDPRTILDHYFRAEAEGKTQLNEAKMLIVGNEAAGKSSLVKFLIDDKPASPTLKTPGVDIQERIDVARWDAGTPGEADPLRLNVWDFGGQEVLYETHRFFLTARSLYLLVLDARRENTRDADETVHEWMRTIRAKAGDPPVIVVVNKADHGQDLRLDETRLRADYPNLVDFVRTSCLDPATCPDGGKGIAALRRLIVETVRETLEHVRDWLPTSYFEVKEALGKRARRESILDTRAYRKKCATKKIRDPVEQANLLDLLDKIGVVVKYDDATLLDPNWLTTAVYRLLTHADVVKADGELARDDLGRLLKGLPPEKYPPDRWDFILEMMRRFHLGFELPDQPGRYLIPEQLPPSEPYLTWDEAGSLRFRFGYDQLPHGLIPRFIVETHDKLPKQRCAWANGVVLEIDGCRVLVRSDRKNRRVDVFVDGPPARCRGALKEVRDRFARVHDLYSELNPRELVPLPDQPDLEVDYRDLVKLEKFQVETFLPPGADWMYRVADLLNKVDPGRRRPGPGPPDPDPAPKPPAPLPVEAFFSYARKDKKLRDELEEYLVPLRRQRVLVGWHDGEILPGQEWGPEIVRHLESAGIILLLASQSFLASDYIETVEMKRALERHEAGLAVVIPIIVRDCDWRTGSFAKLQALPANAKAVMSWTNRAKAWTDVAQGIRKAAEALRARLGGEDSL